MTTKAKANATPGVDKPKTTPVKPIKESKGFDFEFLTKRIRDRSLLLKHLEKLNTVKQNPDFLEELNGQAETEENISKISLQFGDGYNNKYEVDNPVLLEQVTQFLMTSFKSKLAEVEADIESLKV